MVLCLRTSIIYTVRVRKAAEATALSSGFLGLHPPPPPRTPIILMYRIPVRPVCKRCVKCNKEPWDYAENVKQLVDHSEA